MTQNAFFTTLPFFLFALGTSLPADAQDGQHPRSSLIPGADSISFRLQKTVNRKEIADTLLEKAEQLRQAEPIRTIGKREGAPEEMFGKVADIEIRPNGQIYVLDSKYREVRRYGDENTPLGTVGGSGQGPKQFREPTGLALFGDSVLAVLDPQRLELKMFRRTAQGLQHQRTIRHGMPRSHMCSLEDRIVFQAVRPPKSQPAASSSGRPLLHIFSLDGTLRASFGNAYRAEDTVLSLQLSGGPVGCVEERQMLVTALQGTPMLYGYEASGSRAWITRIEDYAPVRVQKEGPTTKYGSGGERAEDVTRRITPLPTGDVLVQVIHRTPQSIAGPQPWDHVATYLVAPATGRGVYVGKNLPLIMEAHENRLYGAVSHPYPHVKIYGVEAP